jgi:hypothetical protein
MFPEIYKRKIATIILGVVPGAEKITTFSKATPAPARIGWQVKILLRDVSGQGKSR